MDRTRDPQASNDFLRLVYLPHGVEPSGRLGAPSAVRVFAGAAAMFDPPLPLVDVADFFGIADDPDRELLVMRCRPDTAAALDACLASWPETFRVIELDLGSRFTCPPQPGSAENALLCLARTFADPPEPEATLALLGAFTVGSEMVADAQLAGVLRQRYGIFPSFSGLGLSVRGSGSGAPLTATEALRKAVVTEYLLLNATLADGGCRCIRVAPYAGRTGALLDIDFVERRGALGSCRPVERLARGH
ncbi:MAG: hypothetical protein AB7V27_12140 [Candidatus Binatia bacterium]